MSRAVSLVLVCAAALALGGCASSGSAGGTVASGAAAGSAPAGAGSAPATAAAGSAVKDPCALVTAADIKSVTGLAVDAPRTNDAGISKLCAYPFDPSSDDDDFNVGITLVTDPESQSDFQADQGPMGATSVSGVGGAAYWSDDKDQLYVWQNNVVFEVGVTGDNDKVANDNAQSTAVSLAKIAVTRL